MDELDNFSGILWRAGSCRSCDRLQGVLTEDVIESPGKVTCALCNQTVANMHELVIHMRNHNNIRPFACSRCDVCFASVALLMLHRCLNHSRRGHYLCYKCNVWIEGIGEYRKHMKSHRPQGFKACWSLCVPHID
ncbi:zinc finger protein 322-like [Ornithodoros turicata]|uniref:zinc finger protein 322-like n=1 Tax=Ornithodoros turicata TaxID=34597 RepID=UPI00313909A8